MERGKRLLLRVAIWNSFEFKFWDLGYQCQMIHWPDEEEMWPIFFRVCQNCPGLLGHRSWYCGARSLGEIERHNRKSCSHHVCWERDSHKGKCPCLANCNEWIPKEWEYWLFKNHQVAGASAPHGEGWGGGGYVCAGSFPTRWHYRVGDYPRIFPILNGHEGRCVGVLPP